MTRCAAYGCRNASSGQHNISGTDKKLVRIPKDEPVRSRWISNLKRPGENLPLDRNLYVCSDHFHSDQFEVDMKVNISKSPWEGGGRHPEISYGFPQ